MSTLEEKTRATSITTYTGKRVWPTDLKVADIDPLDIAHAISNLCRYNGHVSFFYSVVQHSCLVYDYGPEELKKQLLTHDFSEAYCGDLIAPLKHTDDFKFYCELEDRIMEKICERFDLPLVFDPMVKEIDEMIREAEIRDLKNSAGHTRRRNVASRFDEIKYWSPKRAKKELIKRMNEVGIEVNE